MSVQKYVGADGKVSWFYVIVVGEAGARKREQRSNFRTKREATNARNDELKARREGTYIEESKETVGELLARWLNTIARHKVKAKTLSDYESTIRLHLVPYLGDIRVQNLTAAKVQTFYSERVDAGVGTRTINLAHQRLSQALAVAEREGIVRRNVCELVEVPQHKYAPGKAWTQEEANRFLEVARKHYLHPLWALELATGLRRGELLGLRWQDVYLESGIIQIRQAITIVKGAPVVGEPKTDASKRRMGIPADIVQALRDHRVTWEGRRDRAVHWEGDLVFCTRNGKPLNPNNVYRHLYPLMEQAGVPKIRLHDARHTHGTILVSKGVSIRAVADRLGHSKTSVTLNTYAHVLPTMRDEALEAIEEALFRAPALPAEIPASPSRDDPPPPA